MTDKANETDTATEAHDELAFHAALLVDEIIPSTARHFNLCLSCFGREIIRQIEAALTCLEAREEPDDAVGAPEGNA